MKEAAQVLVDAISVGGLYALTALGIGMIFGVMRLVNFAHADLITFAGYAILSSSPSQQRSLSLPPRSRRLSSHS